MKYRQISPLKIFTSVSGLGVPE